MRLGVDARPSITAIRQSAWMATKTRPEVGDVTTSPGKCPTRIRLWTWMSAGSRGWPSMTSRDPVVRPAESSAPRALATKILPREPAGSAARPLGNDSLSAAWLPIWPTMLASLELDVGGGPPPKPPKVQPGAGFGSTVPGATGLDAADAAKL